MFSTKSKTNIAAICVLIFFTHPTYAATGAYSSTATGPTIYAPNLWYTTNFPVIGSPPASSKTNSVVWSYIIGPAPTGSSFVAYLCHGSTATCINVTDRKSGSTTDFMNDGISANTKFFLYYKIDHNKAFPSVYGGSNKIIVNWGN